MTDYFADLPHVQYEGPDSDNPFAYRHYNPEEQIGDKTLAEHLRLAVCYWHHFVWDGSDPFGGPTFQRPWFGATDMQHAKLKADNAFGLFDRLGQPFFCFHDHDVRPEGETLAQSHSRLQAMTDYFAQKMESRDIELLWGTANLFSHRRYMSGAATNPDPEVFAYAAATVKHAMDATHQLGGHNYVLWGGREGYETLLNSDLKQERLQYGRFLSMVVEYKHKIGFPGTILIEPKPQEPTKHQYDYDVATVHGFLHEYGLHNEVKVNIETGHAVLAGHSFEHEIATAGALGIFGSIDANRNDYQSGWDTDQFPNNVPEMALAYYYILQAGGFQNGGTNFDSKLRRQSSDPQDLILGHIGGIDTCARAFKAAYRMQQDGVLSDRLDARYANWHKEAAHNMLHHSSLDAIAHDAVTRGIDPQPCSGQQEYLENLVNRYV